VNVTVNSDLSRLSAGIGSSSSLECSGAVNGEVQSNINVASVCSGLIITSDNSPDVDTIGSSSVVNLMKLVSDPDVSSFIFKLYVVSGFNPSTTTIVLCVVFEVSIDD
jgi:hypothetical protein